MVEASVSGPRIGRSVCPLDCPDTCTLEVETTDGKITAVRGSRANPVTSGFICAKVAKGYPELLNSEARVTRALVRDGPKGAGKFRAVPVNEAVEMVISRLGAIAAEWGPEAILPYSYGGNHGILNDASFDRRFFGMLGASKLQRTICATPSSHAYESIYGPMISVDPQELVHARAVIIWGGNPAVSAIHTMPLLHELKRRGGKVIVIDPRTTGTAKIADLHVRVRVGGDFALAMALHARLLAEGRAAQDFLAAHTTGLPAFEAYARRHSWNEWLDLAGVPEAQASTLFDLYVNTEPTLIRPGYGPERHHNGRAAYAAIMTLPLVAGKFGARGGGLSWSTSPAFKLDREALELRSRHRPARALNMSRLGEILLDTELAPPVKALFVYNANPMVSAPNQNLIRRGLLREDLFTVVHELTLTPTARLGDVVLPATSVFEHTDLHKAYGTRYLQLSTPLVPAPPDAMANTDLFRRLGQAFFPGDAAFLTSMDDLMRAALGSGRYDAASAALREGPVDVHGPGGPPLPFQTVFPAFPDGRARLPFQDPAEWGDETPEFSEAFPYAFISPSGTHAQNSTFGQLRASTDLETLSMHPGDAHREKLTDGCEVTLASTQGSSVFALKISADMPSGVLMAPKGMWSGRSHVNALTTSRTGKIDGGACFYSTRVRVVRKEQAA